MKGLFSRDIAVLDVASRYITALIGTKKAQSLFSFGANVKKQHQGYENGEWFDAGDTSRIAVSALREALDVSDAKSKRLFIGAPAEFVTCVTKEVSVVFDRQRRVVDSDVENLFKNGETFNDGKYAVINSSAIYFTVDADDRLYSDVRGMSAVKLNACVSYILCERGFIAMFDKVASECGFKDTRYIASNWAECIALLEKEQRDNVYTVINVGYLSTSVTIGKGDGIIDMKSFSLGGAHVSADIYTALDVPFELAEESKELVDLTLNYLDGEVLVSNGESTVTGADACVIAKGRLDVFADIISDVLAQTEDYAPAYMPVYLTGEGIADMRGAKKYLSDGIGKNVQSITPKLPGFEKAGDSTYISLLLVAETLSDAGFGAFLKSIFNGGKI